MDYRELAYRVLDESVDLHGLTIDVDRAAEVLRSALTPTWTDTPAPLPEGAVWGVYASRSREFPSFCVDTRRWSAQQVQDIRSGAFTGFEHFLLLAAFDAAGEVVK